MYFSKWMMYNSSMTSIQKDHMNEFKAHDFGTRGQPSDGVVGADNVTLIMVSDIVEANGKTIRQNNLEREHDVPLGTLVEITCDPKWEDPENPHNGLRLFVVNHSRDCDGTPLYDMSFELGSYKTWKQAKDKIDNRDFEDHMDEGLTRWTERYYGGRILRHFGRDSLIVIKSAA